MVRLNASIDSSPSRSFTGDEEGARLVRNDNKKAGLLNTLRSRFMSLSSQKKFVIGIIALFAVGLLFDEEYIGKFHACQFNCN